MNHGFRIVTFLTGLAVAGDVAVASAQKPVVTLTSSASSIAERITTTRTTTTTTLSRTSTPASNAAVLTVTRTTASLLTNLTVSYSVSGTALNGKDYSALSGTVTIPNGASSTSFTVTAIDDIDDEADETIVIALVATATSPYVLTDPASATIRIIDDDDVRLVGLDIVTDSILGGTDVDVKVSLSGAAPAGGAVVSVSASSGAASVSDITVAAGTRAATGRIRTTTTTNPVSIVVKGVAGGVSQADTLVIFPMPRVTQLTLSAGNAFGGAPVTATVQLDAGTPIGIDVELHTRVVTMLASRTSLTTSTSLTTTTAGLTTSSPLTVPSMLHLPAGAVSGQVSLQSTNVSGPVGVEVSAAHGAATVSDTVTVHPIPVIASADVAPATVEGGTEITSTIRLASPIPAGLSWIVYLSSSQNLVQVGQANVAFRSGDVEWSRNLQTRPVPSVTQDCLRITGPVNRSGGCVSILPPPITAFVAAREQIFGGQNVTGTLTASRAVAIGSRTIPVGVRVISPAGVQSPIGAASIQLPAGEISTNWSLPSTPVSQATTIEIGIMNGPSDTVVVHPMPVIASATLSPAAVVGGDAVTSSIELEAPVPQGLSWAVYLSSGRGLLLTNQVVANFTGGSSSWNRAIQTRPVPSLDSDCLRLTGPVNRSGGCVSLRPPPITEFNVARDAVFGGQSIGGTLTASRAVTLGVRTIGINVQVLDPAGAASPIVASAVQLPAGEISTNWSLATTPVSQATTVAIGIANGPSDTVVVHPMPVIASATLAPAAVVGGEAIVSEIQLESPIPQGLTWSVYLSSGKALILTGQTAVYFGGGSQMWSRSLQTRPVPSLDSDCLRLTGPVNRSGGCVSLRPPPITEFVASRSTVFGGQSIGGTLTASHAVTISGRTIPVSVQVLSPAGAAAPVSTSAVTLPAGQASASWSFATTPVTQPVTIEIGVPNGAADTIIVHPAPMIASTELQPSTVESGTRVDATIRLESPIPPDLSWSGTVASTRNLIQAGSGIARFAAGASEWTGSYPTRPVASSEQDCIRIQFPLVPTHSGGCVTLLPPAITSVRANEHVAFAGNGYGFGGTISGSLTARAAATTGSRSIPLSVRVIAPAGATPPVTVSSVVLAPGQASAGWSFATNAVTQATTVEIGVPNGPADTVVLHPLPNVSSITLTPDPVVGGSPVQARIRFDAPVPPTLHWDLLIQGYGGLIVPVPSVRFDAGQSEWIGTFQTTPVTQPTVAQLNAKNGLLQQTVTLLPPVAQRKLASFDVAPAGTIIAGARINLSVVLDGAAPSGGSTVQLRSSHRNAIDPPATLIVPAGARTASVQLVTNAIASAVTVTLEATLGSPIQRSVSLVPAPIDRVQVPNSVQAGTQSQGFVRLTQPAPAGGLEIPLASSSAAAVVPSSVTIPAGATQISFSIQVGSVAQDTDVTITAGANQASTSFRIRAR